MCHLSPREVYIGVDPARRRSGVGRRLIEVSVRLLQVDACCEGDELPFVVWESRPPQPDDEPGRRGWEARLGLWQRVGARWVSGLTFHAVNYHRRQAAPVPLQLFLLPVDRPAQGFDAAALRQVAAGLLREVYRRQSGDPHYDLTLPPGCSPTLRPADEARLVTA
jgi:GNAT superfamily N-acetyltransferase